MRPKDINDRSSKTFRVQRPVIITFCKEYKTIITNSVLTRSGHHMLGSLHSLLEGFVEACTFHAWSLLL